MLKKLKEKGIFVSHKMNLKEHIFIALGLLLYAGAWKAFLLPHQ